MPNPPLEKITINIREGDRETLRFYHSSMTYNQVIRKLVADHCDKLKSTTQGTSK